MANELTIGTHRVRIDGDTVLTRYIGVPELEHVQAIHAHLDRVLAEHGRVFVVNDMRRTGVPSTATRGFISDWARSHPVAGVANFGASLPIRVMQAMIMRASALLGRKLNVVVIHCASEADALAWVDARRRELSRSA